MGGTPFSKISRVIATYWVAVLYLASVDAGTMTPTHAEIPRRAVTANSRPMMTTAIQAGQSVSDAATKISAAIRACTRDEEIMNTTTRGTRTIRVSVRKMGMFTSCPCLPGKKPRSLCVPAASLSRLPGGDAPVPEEGNRGPRVHREAGGQIFRAPPRQQVAAPVRLGTQIVQPVAVVPRRPAGHRRRVAQL